jgi:hypothetical protein
MHRETIMLYKAERGKAKLPRRTAVADEHGREEATKENAEHFHEARRGGQST